MRALIYVYILFSHKLHIAQYLENEIGTGIYVFIKRYNLNINANSI